MRAFLPLLAASILSLLLYLLVFGFLVSRPMVVDQAQEMLEKKMAYGLAARHPQIVIVAGSNARFSHSCAVLEQLLHRPCTNLGVAGTIGIDWTLDAARQILKRGDLAYMPVEFDIYPHPRAQLLTGMDAAYRFRHDKASLAERGPEGVIRAAFMFSLPTLVQSLGEMALAEAGVRRRFGLDTLNKQGDEIGHDGAKANAYLATIRSESQRMPETETLLTDPEAGAQAIASFLDWCRVHGVTAVGGLPTVFNDRPIPDAPIAELRAFYGKHGAGFLVLPNRSQYPRSAFYDSDYHLRESWQRRHSVLLAAQLRPLLSHE
jgi:hypothetical protein